MREKAADYFFPLWDFVVVRNEECGMRSEGKR